MLSVEYGVLFSDERILLWMDALKDKDLHEINLAVRSIIRTWTHHRAPRLADVLEAIDGSTEWKAIQHWASVLAAVTKCTLTSDSLDPIVLQTISMIGGVKALQEMTLKDTPYLRSQFVKSYIYIHQDLSREQPLKITDGNQPDTPPVSKSYESGQGFRFVGRKTTYRINVDGYLDVDGNCFDQVQVRRAIEKGEMEKVDGYVKNPDIIPFAGLTPLKIKRPMTDEKEAHKAKIMQQKEEMEG